MTFRCGHVGIVGRPNVGKSTLLNRFLGQKLSITSRRPQTTRHSIVGIKNFDNAQAIYVDTPGLHTGRERALNRYLNRAVATVLAYTDVIIFVVDRTAWTEQDECVLKQIKNQTKPVILVINKVDRLKDKSRLLPQIEKLAKQMMFTEIIPVSAKQGDNIDALENQMLLHLPPGDAQYPADQITNRSERFFATEMIREKLIRHLGAEMPYALTVTIESFKENKDRWLVDATIWVETKGQKIIVIGKHGSVLKSVGSQARKDIETMLEQKVYLQLWVKIKRSWSNDDAALQTFGYVN